LKYINLNMNDIIRFIKYNNIHWTKYLFIKNKTTGLNQAILLRKISSKSAFQLKYLNDLINFK